MNDDSATQTASYGRRAAAYWSVDGLPEILRGLALVVLTGSGYLWRAHSSRPPAGFFLFLGIPIYVFLVERVALDFLKSRITYPRTGYVQPPEPSWGGSKAQEVLSLRTAARENVTLFWPRTFTPLLVVAGLGMSVRDLLGHWLLPLAMPALAITLYLANRTAEHPYPWWSTLALALTGLAFLRVSVAATLQWPLVFMVTGAWLMAQGAYALVHYLRANPQPQIAEGVKA